MAYTIPFCFRDLSLFAFMTNRQKKTSNRPLLKIYFLGISLRISSTKLQNFCTEEMETRSAGE